MMKMIVLKPIEYDEELTIQPGEYEYIENGINAWPMIKVNDEWLDIMLEGIDDYFEIK